MEIVLLWLDDLDDLLFTAALAWESLRRAFLKIGLAAACALGTCELSMMAMHWVPVFNFIAVGSVTAWLFGGLLRLYYRRVRPISLAA